MGPQQHGQMLCQDSVSDFPKPRRRKRGQSAPQPPPAPFSHHCSPPPKNTQKTTFLAPQVMDGTSTTWPNALSGLGKRFPKAAPQKTRPIRTPTPPCTLLTPLLPPPQKHAKNNFPRTPGDGWDLNNMAKCFVRTR